MAKRPAPGRCVHCLVESEQLTWDHVFPLSWYPDSTPENLEKWKIPSCLECNHLHSKSEGELLVKLGLCVKPEEIRSAGIAEKALRATSASEARNEKDAKLREAKRQSILAQRFVGEKIPRQAIYPGFGPLPEQSVKDQVAIPVSAKSIRRLAEKVVRGLIYLQDGRLVQDPFTIDCYVLDDGGTAPIKQALEKFGISFERGPGIRVSRAVTPEDGMSGFYEVEIWGRFKIYVAVMDASREKSS